MQRVTLCLCVKDNQVLLAKKRCGFGEGKWNGYGGKVHANEGPKTAAIRELAEESGLVACEKDLQHVAIIRFYFDAAPIFECYVYLLYTWQNEPTETEEMMRPQWFPITELPFENMWAGDSKWIPLILNGEKIEAQVIFTANGSALKEFSYTKVEFN